MPTTTTRQHRADLDEVAGSVRRHVRAATSDVDPADIDAWWSGRTRTIGQIVTAGFNQSVSLAGRYLVSHAAEAGVTVQPVLAAIDLAQLATSLRVAGPVAFKQRMRLSGDPADAANIMRRRLAGAAERQALAGARETVSRTIGSADVIIGYQRVTATGACDFCQMLEGRGAVYLSQESAGQVVGRRGRPRGVRAVRSSFHDNCRCTVEPVYGQALIARQITPAEQSIRADAREDRLRRRANVERIRAEAAAARAQLDAGKATATGGRVDPAVLDRWGVTEAQYRNARAVVADIKADIRNVARREADDIGAWLLDNDLGELSRPDRLRRSVDIFGSTRSTRQAAGYDFLETLDDAELRRVRNRMVDSDLFPPDLLAEQVRRKTNLDLTDDEAIDWLVDRWLHEDALRSLASGRVPRYANPDNLIPADYGLEGYRIDRLFGVDDVDAVGHVAQVQADAARVNAQRLLGNPSAGPAPWEMDAADYAAELDDVERILAAGATEGTTDPAVAWAERRLRELAPRDLDETGSANPFELHEAIRVTAQTAGLL